MKKRWLWRVVPQITGAAKCYLDVLNTNPDAKISFTGHSLGGSLPCTNTDYLFESASEENSTNRRRNTDGAMQALRFGIRHYPIPQVVNDAFYPEAA